MNNIKKLIVDLFKFPLSVTGKGNDDAVDRLQKELPFVVYEYESGKVLNGWVIPPAHEVKKANLFKDGKLIFDGTFSALHTPAQSDSFNGELHLSELKEHLFSSDNPEAIPYHWENLYRTNQNIWGFCMPKKIKDNLEEGTYKVEIETKKTSSTMKVLVYELKGDTDECFLLNAHNCHPLQANDDLSGVAVGVEIMHRLKKLNRRRYTYKLMIAPELFGPMFWLDQLDSNSYNNIKGVIMHKSVGNKKPLRFQESYSNSAAINRACHHVFKSRYKAYDYGKYRTIYGNDETVFESPPYRIPSVSLTRWPFDEYHTSLDTPDKLNDSSMEDTVEATLDIINVLEKDIVFNPVFNGLVCLSKYGLYKSLPPVTEDGIDYENTLSGRWNLLMNSLPCHLDDGDSVLTIAEKYNLPIDDVFEYLCKWEDQGLIARS